MTTKPNAFTMKPDLDLNNRIKDEYVFKAYLKLST